MEQSDRGVIDLMLKELSQSNGSQGNASATSCGKCVRPTASAGLCCENVTPVDNVAWGVAPYDGQVRWDPTGDCRFISEGIVDDGHRYIEVYFIPSQDKRVWFDRGPISAALA